MTAKRPVLGRGLNALLKDSEKVKNENKPISEVSNINEILIENIEANPFQPRTHFDQEALKELAESIKVHGIIQPITVRKLSEGKYQLISGERRWQASKL
ncbi:MAG TPA: ParB/RepB/Spo0J family partition protein, partial [Cytophagaceae bacterium]|nr:ParB/RepB/Spo0J family partition protein [Cytophagaceae bacterium]